MKKFIKSLTMLCFAIVLCVPMLVFAGCTKNYTINVSVKAGEGNVYKKVLEDKDQKNYVGKNTVKGGEKFEYYVVPSTGYEIEKVVVNGEEANVTNVAGTYFYIDKVDQNYTIEVYFKEKMFTVTFQCSDGAEFYLQKNYKFGTYIDFNDNEFGGNNNNFWYVLDSSNNKKSISAEHNNRLFVGGDMIIKTSKTLAELNSAIGL